MAQRSVEILLAGYNGAAYLREQIDSILAQTVRDWHLTLSDDGSSDGTAEIMDEYAQQYPDRIARVRSGRRFGGARPHFWWLLSRCEADCMFTCDQDDVWLPEKLEKTLAALDAAEREAGAETPLLVFCDSTPVDARLQPLAPSMLRYQGQRLTDFNVRTLMLQNAVTGGAMCVNRPLVDLALRCADPEAVIMHDHWLALAAARFGRVIYVDEPLYLYRQHGGNQVGAQHVGSASYVSRTLRSLKTIRTRLQEKKAQARAFANTYDDMLTEDDRAFLTQFCKNRSGPLFYWKNRREISGFWRLAGMMLLG